MRCSLCEKRVGWVSLAGKAGYSRYHGQVEVGLTSYGHREVLVRGYVDTVEISCGAETIARHGRQYERKTSSSIRSITWRCSNKSPARSTRLHLLAGWDLPEVFATLRRLLEARMGKQGKRGFEQGACWKCSRSRMLRSSIPSHIDRGVHRRCEAFTQVGERRPARTSRMTVHPYLPRASVAITSARTYLDLLSGAAS